MSKCLHFFKNNTIISNLEIKPFNFFLEEPYHLIFEITTSWNISPIIYAMYFIIQNNNKKLNN